MSKTPLLLGKYAIIVPTTHQQKNWPHRSFWLFLTLAGTVARFCGPKHSLFSFFFLSTAKHLEIAHAFGLSKTLQRIRCIMQNWVLYIQFCVDQKKGPFAFISATNRLFRKRGPSFMRILESLKHEMQNFCAKMFQVKAHIFSNMLHVAKVWEKLFFNNSRRKRKIDNSRHFP